MPKKLLICLLPMIMPITAIASIIIDFEELSIYGEGSYLGTSVYQEDGFTLTTYSGTIENPSEFWFFRNTISGSLVLSSRYPGDTIRLSQDNGEPFDLYSMVYSHVHTPAIEFTGMRSDLTQVSFIYSPIVMSTITFSDFNDLLWVSWVNGGGYNNFDDITIIPEPTGICLLSLGALGLLFKKRIHS